MALYSGDLSNQHINVSVVFRLRMRNCVIALNYLPNIQTSVEIK